MIIVSDFNNTLEIDREIDPELFSYLLAMALGGHKVAIFSVNPDQARDHVHALARNKEAIDPLIEAIKARNPAIGQEADEVRADLLGEGLIHIDSKLNLNKWLEGRKIHIGFDDEPHGSAINTLSCHHVIDRHSDEYDHFMIAVKEHGAEQASSALVTPRNPPADPAPGM